MTPVSAPEDLGTLWLHVLQRAIGRVSHDVKDALNGVSVNLEVIRSRAQRADTPATALGQFASAAGQQLDRLTILTEAVLALARAERAHVDVGLALRRVVTVCGASSLSTDATVRVIDEGTLGSATTAVSGDAVRLALAAPLLEAVDCGGRSGNQAEVTCSLSSHGDAVHVVIASSHARVVMPESVAEAVRAAGVHWTEGDRALCVIFPHP